MQNSRVYFNLFLFGGIIIRSHKLSSQQEDAKERWLAQLCALLIYFFFFGLKGTIIKQLSQNG